MRIQFNMPVIACALACTRYVAAAILAAAVALGTPAFAVKPYEPGEGGSSDPYPPGVGESTNPTTPGTGGAASTPEVSITGRVSSLRIQKANNPIVYFSLDNPAGCSVLPKAYFFAKSDVDYDYALKALVAARVAGREVKLQGVTGCPDTFTLVSASAVRMIDSSPQNGPPSTAASGTSGLVTNLKLQQGVVYFRIASCSGSAPYFKFTSKDLPGGLGLLIAAQSAKRQVQVSTSISGNGECPAAGGGDVDLGWGGLWLL